MVDTPEEQGAELPRDLRFLKGLVTVLTAVMILGVLTIVALLVIRLNAGSGAILVHPDTISLPDGVNATGYSISGDAIVVVGDDGLIRVFDSGDGALLQEIPVRPAR